MVVEEAVHARVPAQADRRRVVLDRRRVDLAVTVVLEDLPELVRERTELTHLVGQDVARPARDWVHRSHGGQAMGSPGE